MTQDFYKRILDLILASILLVLFLPFWIIVPIAIYIDSGLPIFFKHKRIGKNGKEFYLYKFRSMIPNADEILHKHNSELLKKFKQGDWKIKAKDDPRITWLGRILRALTIDEFPQLFNVFKGDMSMIGPRAYVKKELEEQSDKYPETKKYISKILSIKPGITGVWQTSGRNEIPFTQRAKLDADYADHHNLKQDLLIVLKTPMAMLSKW